MWVETLVMAAALGVIAAFFLVDERYRDHIRFGGSVLGATGAALAAVFGYGQLHEFERSHAFEVEQHREVVRHRRQAVSFGFIDHFQEVSRPEVHELAKRLRTLGDEEMIRLVNDRTEDGAMIEEILNFFEHMALAANSRYADEKVLCRYFRSIAQQGLQLLEPVVLERRKTPERETSWKEYEVMVKRWKKGCEISVQPQVFAMIGPAGEAP